MKRMIIALAIGVFSFALLAGCGKNDAVAETTELPPTTESLVTTESEAPKSVGYTYTDVAGRTFEFDKEPEQIAVTYLPLWETMLMLDVKPIAAGGAEQYIATWPPFEGLELSGIEDIGSREVNLELLASLKPDLILAQVQDPTNLEIDNYEKIANTVVFTNDTKMDWRLSLREVGKLLNRIDKAEEAILEVEQRLTQARASFENLYKDQTVVIASMMAIDKLVYANRGEFYDKENGLGLNTPEGFSTDPNYTDLTIEKLVEMNPDYIFLTVFAGDEAKYEELSQNVVWQSLKAVKSDQIFIITGAGHSPSPMSTVYTIDYIIEKLTK